MNPLLDFASDTEEVLLSDRSGRIIYKKKPVSFTITREHVFVDLILPSQSRNNSISSRKHSASSVKSMSQTTTKKTIVTMSAEDLIGMQYFPLKTSTNSISESNLSSLSSRNSAMTTTTSSLASNTSNSNLGLFRVEFYFYPPKEHWRLWGSSKSKTAKPQNHTDTDEHGFTSSYNNNPNIKWPLDRVSVTLTLYFQQSTIAECMMWKRAVHEAARQIVLTNTALVTDNQNATTTQNTNNGNKSDNNNSKNNNGSNNKANTTNGNADGGGSQHNPISLLVETKVEDTNNNNNTTNTNTKEEASVSTPTRTSKVTRYSASSNNNNNNAANFHISQTSSAANSVPVSPNHSQHYAQHLGGLASPGPLGGVLNSNGTMMMYHPHHRLYNGSNSNTPSRAGSVQNAQVLGHSVNNSTANITNSNNTTIDNNNNNDHVFNVNDPYYDSSYEDIPHPADPPYYPGYFRPIATLTRHFLVIISPKSGPGKSLSYWEKYVQPMLHQADITYTVYVTQYKHHGYQLGISEIPRHVWASCDGVIVLGGDGIVYEIVNGILARTDSDESSTSNTQDITTTMNTNTNATNSNAGNTTGAKPKAPEIRKVVSTSPHYAANLALLRRVTLCPLGGGTGNGLITSILHENHSYKKNMVNAVFTAIKGFRHPLDLTRVTSYGPSLYPATTSTTAAKHDTEDSAHDNTTNVEEHHAFLTLMWGMLADVDIHSEYLRFLGETRLYLYAVKAIIEKKRYYACLKMKLVTQWSTYTSEGSFYEHRVNQLLPSVNAGNNKKKKLKNTLANANGEQVDSDGWLTILDAFVSVNVFQVSHISTSTHVCPGKKLNEGLFVITMVSAQIPRHSLIQMMLTADEGGLLQNPYVRVFRCSAYELEPLHKSTYEQRLQEELDEANNNRDNSDDVEASNSNGKKKKKSGSNTTETKKAEGVFSLDGERIPYGKVCGEILPNAARIML